MPPRPLTKTPERDVLKAVTDLLSAHKIWFERRNTGAFGGTHNGRKRFVRFGTPGVADVMAIISCWRYRGVGPFTPLPDGGQEQECERFRAVGSVLWIECKAPKGRQTPEQKAFEQTVREHGMEYLLVRDVDVLIQWLREQGIR